MKAQVTLGGVPLAATTGVGWRLVAGTTPYVAGFEVHKHQWETLRGLIGQPLTMSITDQRGETTEVEKLYVLHQVASSSPNRVAVLVADQRWKWKYPLIVRDYNMPRKTGLKSASPNLPIPVRPIIDEYKFLAYSLKGGRDAWSAQDAVEDVLGQIAEETGSEYSISSFPVENGSGTDGQLSIQGVQLRESADVALSRLLSYVPGAAVYITQDGRIEVIDATDLSAAEAALENLPANTWRGDKAAVIDRKAIRPSKIRVYYQREVELLVEHQDDYSGGTSSQLPRDTPYVENVITTVAEQTESSQYEPESDATVKRTVVPGVWIPMHQLFEDLQRRGVPAWGGTVWEALKLGWARNDIDGLFRSDIESDDDEFLSVQSAIQSIKQHFRQTFQINRRYMSRIRDLLPVRSAIIDPVTGARSPAVAWPQGCIIPSRKGQRVSSRKEDGKFQLWRNVDYESKLASGEPWDTPPAPVQVSVLDPQLGVFRIDWIASPYGTDQAFIPCNIVNDGGSLKVPIRDLSKQDEEPMGAGIQVEGSETNLSLRDCSRMKAIMTIVPSSPNNKRQFHVEEVEASEIAGIYKSTYRIQDGAGPVLEVFVSPPVTARFQWRDTSQARSTIQRLLGLDNDDPNDAGIDGNELPGFELSNGVEGSEDNVLRAHALAVAAEYISPFADSVQGQVRTRSDPENLRLVGNMRSASVSVSSAPSAIAENVYDFPGQQQRVSRMALLPESARGIILGTLPFR